jgi:ribosomal protein S27E
MSAPLEPIRLSFDDLNSPRVEAYLEAQAILLVARIGEMLAYQSYNTKSPLNGEAARWVSDNLERLPLDPVSMLIDQMPASRAAPSRAPSPAAAPAAPPSSVLVIECPQCQSQLKIPSDRAGKRIRCPKCQSILLAPSA